MNDTRQMAGERAFNALAAALDGFSAAPGDTGAARRLEPLLDALYATAVVRGRSALRELDALLASKAEALPAVDAWLALVRLHLARRKQHGLELAALDATLDGAPPRTRWLVASEAARVVWQREGPASAWNRMRLLEPVPADESWQQDSPLVVSAILTRITLAAARGARDVHDRISAEAQAFWPADHPSALRVTIALAEDTIARGNFRDALRRLRAIEGAARGDLRMHLLSVRLHALVSSGRGSTRRARATYRAFREAAQAPSVPGFELPSDQRRALEDRTRQVARAAGLCRAGRRPTTTLSRLLQREREARRIKDPARRIPALRRVIRRAEVLLLRPEAAAHPEELVRLKLLWCRLVVDLDQDDMFDTCERILEQALAAADRLDLDPLRMLTLDQRAVLRARKSPPNWKGALVDSTGAASIALKILAANADPGAKKGTERSLLASLLPVIDRVIDLHTEGALRIAARHGELLSMPLGAPEPHLDAETPRGSFLRFGRILHTFAEQSQALALAEARIAFEDGRTVPHRFAVAVQGEARIVVDGFCQKLRGEDAVLQYFVFGRYMLVFAYGRSFFEWHVTAIPESEGSSRSEPAHRRLDELLRALRGWTQGESHSEDDAALVELHALLVPTKIDEALALAGVRHLRIVPHDVLYRIPFGRLVTRKGPLLHRFSMSLHPTGQLAAESAEAGRARLERRPVLGFVFGPQVDSAAEEEQAIRAGTGAIASLARVEVVDGAATNLEALLGRAPAFELLHFLCHGDEGGGFGRSPALRLGIEEDGRLELPRVLRMPLRRCELVVLQSCWTGWMDHRRTNPVQGFPQAFCDAGAGAVIAPLTKIPQALAPLFAEVLYRTLRFLPAEQALQRTMAVLRTHGGVLVAQNPEASRVLAEHGSMDAFEYRYMGATGLTLGGFVSRLVGRVSFWWWERGLRRARNSKEKDS
ncbi:CHAT domain-containing protein [Polyangium sp. y55x31]|uniref:CHAT domain-containing protein n=1 Tax=Polyangium sp. y55x31 TaxID=3042688 RepID=UPI00248225D2|nr:CHAT domain-containing protein [Polyangium sp. y55x31]MDI1479254.1 CHAT domain-containing protein [Polyangium sp. y55x31]